VLLEDDLHDVYALYVVEEHGQVVGHRGDDLGQVRCLALLEYELQEFFLDDIFVERAQVRVDVLEEVGLLGIACGVDVSELYQCLVQLNRVEVVLYLFVHVFL